MEVYFALNRTNGKAYVGWTAKTARVRFKEHCKAARGGKRSYIFHHAISKYGADAFDVITVWKGDDAEEMKQVECNYINGMKTNDRRFGYNMTEGGEGTNGHKVSDAVRALRRDRMMTNNPMGNPEYRKRVSKALKGHKTSKETKDKIRLKAIGRKASSETRAAMSASRTGRRPEGLTFTGCTPWNKGLKGAYTHSDEVKKQISNAKKAYWRNRNATN